MKRNLTRLFIIVASSLLLAGCCTAHHAPEWEYKVGYTTGSGRAEAEEAFLNGLAKDGWILVEKDATTGHFYFKRAKK